MTAGGGVARLAQGGIQQAKPVLHGDSLLLESKGALRWARGGAVSTIERPLSATWYPGTALDAGGDRAVSIFNDKFTDDGAHYQSPAISGGAPVSTT